MYIFKSIYPKPLTPTQFPGVVVKQAAAASGSPDGLVVLSVSVGSTELSDQLGLADGTEGMPGDWDAVKGLKSQYYNRETIFMTTYTHYGDLI